MSIARAVIEHIRDKVGAKTRCLQRIIIADRCEDHDRIKNYCVAVKERGGQVVFCGASWPGVLINMLSSCG